MEIEWKTTGRGFRLGEFSDRYGDRCTIQKSSLATEDAIWLGASGVVRELVPGQGWIELPMGPDTLVVSRMHLTRDDVADLLPVLQHFVETGELP